MPVVTTNTAANSAIRFLNNNSSMAANSVGKLASGSRIVRASDDAAGLAISAKLSADTTALKQAATNASQAASIIQVADGGLARIGDVLQRMKALAAQSLSGAVTNTERGYINTEYSALNSEIADIITTTQFNGQQLINTFNQSFFVGSSASHTITANLTATTVAGPGGDVSSSANASTAMGNIDTQIGNVSTSRANAGALISRFETRGQAVATSIENIEAANSVIKDVDLAAEQSRLVSANVLTQAAVSALSQANQIPQSLLRVLQ
ncbi:flagellin [Kiloniella laminariae]|uniref:flagellin n=1 Tax=Kiloniella laminariae TaxID=454162 RepID=UPI000476C3D7|nr:flagellin [Kiloniella laminariae]